jgi:hypothetical protein
MAERNNGPLPTQPHPVCSCRRQQNYSLVETVWASPVAFNEPHAFGILVHDQIEIICNVVGYQA